MDDLLNALERYQESKIKCNNAFSSRGYIPKPHRQQLDITRKAFGRELDKVIVGVVHAIIDRPGA